MQNNENAMTPAGNLQLIESMINRAKNKFSENGHLYLLWGWTVFICSAGHFVLMKYFEFRNASMIWMLTWLVVIYQVFYLVKNKRKETVRTYTDDIIGYVWLAFIICMMLMAFIVVREQDATFYKVLYPLFLVIYGVPTFLSGVILRFRHLVWGGISCWILAIIATFIPYSYQLLLLSVAMITAWIIPGYALQSKYKKQQ